MIDPEHAVSRFTRPLFHGLSAFPNTPADAVGRVDVRALATLLARLEVAEVDPVGLLGSTGTHAYLIRSEKRRAVEAQGYRISPRTVRANSSDYPDRFRLRRMETSGRAARYGCIN